MSRQPKTIKTPVHLIARPDGVLCIYCRTLIPVHCGNGVALASLLNGYENVIWQHRNCRLREPKEERDG